MLLAFVFLSQIVGNIVTVETSWTGQQLPFPAGHTATLLTAEVGDTISLPCRTSYENRVNWIYVPGPNTNDLSTYDDPKHLVTCGLVDDEIPGKFAAYRQEIGRRMSWNDSLVIFNVDESDAGLYACAEDCGFVTMPVEYPQRIILVVLRLDENSTSSPEFSRRASRVHINPSHQLFNPHIADVHQESSGTDDDDESVTLAAEASRILLAVVGTVGCLVFLTILLKCSLQNYRAAAAPTSGFSRCLSDVEAPAAADVGETDAIVTASASSASPTASSVAVEGRLRQQQDGEQRHQRQRLLATVDDNDLTADPTFVLQGTTAAPTAPPAGLIWHL